MSEPYEGLEDHVWSHPDSYAGFSPVGDYAILGRHRDSDPLSNSNFDKAKELLEAVEAEHEQPAPASDPGKHRVTLSEAEYPYLAETGDTWVYLFSAGHWAVGWCETLMIRKDAPEPILREAAEIVAALSDYPVLDDEDLSNREWEAASDYWTQLSVSERVDLIRKYEPEVSIFAARRDEIPEGNGMLYDYLRTP